MKTNMAVLFTAVCHANWGLSLGIIGYLIKVVGTVYK